MAITNIGSCSHQYLLLEVISSNITSQGLPAWSLQEKHLEVQGRCFLQEKVQGLMRVCKEQRERDAQQGTSVRVREMWVAMQGSAGLERATWSVQGTVAGLVFISRVV